MLTGGVNRGLPGIILFRFTNGEGNVISDFDVITQPDPQRFMQTDLRGLHQCHRGVHNATYRRLIRHAHRQRTNKSNRFHLNRTHFNYLVTAHRLYLVNAHRLYLIVGNRNHLIVANGFSMVVYHIRGAVIQHLGVHVLLHVDVDLFFPCRIVKLQFIKPAALIGFRTNGHLRLRPRQATGCAVFLVVGTPHNNRLVRVAVEEVHNHLLTHTRYRQVAKAGACPRLCHTDPA
ncbi:Uncharacterised protein [Shigella sonnei]|nr:Uncharacterised protein [Shigella sonnei]